MEKTALSESVPKILINKMPHILLIPKIKEKKEITEQEKLIKSKQTVIFLIFMKKMKNNNKFRYVMNVLYIELVKELEFFPLLVNQQIM